MSKNQIRRAHRIVAVGAAFIFAFANILFPLHANLPVHDDSLAISPTLEGGHRKSVPVRDRVRTLVTTQLPPTATIEVASKMDHYSTFLGPSWRRLIEDRKLGVTSYETVLPDLFIACVDEACDKLDEQYCFRLEITNDTATDRKTWRDMLENRHPEDEMLCYYAHVPEREEEYRFMHSLNFLTMEPFASLMKLGYYDYVLRTDADAILFPGLLHLSPRGYDGWIGSGYYGEDITNYIVRHYSQKLLPELEPLRPLNATPPMQSTFYVRASVFEKFVETLMLATRTFYVKAFDERPQKERPICAELIMSENVRTHPQFRKFGGRLKDQYNLCAWPYWMKGVASLYGTRVAVDYVLHNVTVTPALDALATEPNWHDRSPMETIQVHMVNIKQVIDDPYAPDNVTICIDPLSEITESHSWISAMNQALAPWSALLYDAMKTVISSPSAPPTIHHRTAEVFLQLLRHIAGCNFTYHTGLVDVTNEPEVDGSAAAKRVTSESYASTIEEIRWARKKISELQPLVDEKDRLEKEYNRLVTSPAFQSIWDGWCPTCAFSDRASCEERRQYFVSAKHTHPLIAPYKVMESHPQCKDAAKKGVVNEMSLTRDDSGNLVYARSASLSKWCGDCRWSKQTTCDQRKVYLAQGYGLGRISVLVQMMMKYPQCSKS